MNAAPMLALSAEIKIGDVAYYMIMKEEYPSYGHWDAKGETTFMEQFIEYEDYYRLSKKIG